MKAGSVNRFEAWALIVGPVLALLFFLLQPGGMLIDSVESTDSIGRVQALASNATMAHVAALMVPLGLIVMIYGLTGLNRLIVLVEDDMVTLARLCYFPWVLWSITLGARFLKAGSLAKAGK